MRFFGLLHRGFDRGDPTLWGNKTIRTFGCCCRSGPELRVVTTGLQVNLLSQRGGVYLDSVNREVISVSPFFLKLVANAVLDLPRRVFVCMEEGIAHVLGLRIVLPLEASRSPLSISRLYEGA